MGEDLELPDESEARMLNEQTADNFAAGRRAEGMTDEELQSIPAPQRSRLAQDARDDAESQMPLFEDEDGREENPQAVVARVHENHNKFTKAVMAAMEKAGHTRLAAATRAIDLFVSSGKSVIRMRAKRAGAPEVGDDLVRDINLYGAITQTIAGDYSKRYDAIVRKHKLTQEEHDNMVLVLEEAKRRIDETDPKSPMVPVTPLNDKPGQAERIRAAVDDVRKFLGDDVFDLLATNRVYTPFYDENGKRRMRLFADQLKNPRYWPHKYDYDRKIILRDPQTGQLLPAITLRELIKPRKELGEARYEQIVRSLMRARGLTRPEVEDWLANRPRDYPLMGNVEKPREVNMPYYRTDQSAMHDYLYGIGEIVARTQVFGQELVKLNEKIRKVPDPKERQGIRDVFESLLKPSRWEPDTRALVSLGSDLSVWMKMHLSAIKVPFHAAHIAPRLPVKGITTLGMATAKVSASAAKALGRSILTLSKSPRETREWAQFSGASLEQMNAQLRADLGVRRGATQKFLEITQFHNAYNVVRELAAAAARIWLDHTALPALVRMARRSARLREGIVAGQVRLTSRRTEIIRRGLRDVMLLDDDRIDKAVAAKLADKKSTGWTQEDYARASAAFANRIAFTGDPTEVPGYWRFRDQEHPNKDNAWAVLRITTLLHSFMFKTAAMLKDSMWEEVKRGNPRPLIPFFALYPVLGFLMAEINDLLKMHPHTEYQWWKDPKHHTLAQMTQRYLYDLSYPIAMAELWAVSMAYSGDAAMWRAAEVMFGPEIVDFLRTFVGLPVSWVRAKTSYSQREAIRNWLIGEVSLLRYPIEFEEYMTGYDRAKERKKARSHGGGRKKSSEDLDRYRTPL
jgi:hypothetical protein